MSTAENAKRKVTLIGLGSIGSGMAGRLAAADDVELTVFNRSPQRYQAVQGMDLVIADSLEDSVRDAEVVILSLTRRRRGARRHQSDR